MQEYDIPASLFHDPAAGSRNLLVVHEQFIRSGASAPVADFSRALHVQLSASPDPDAALMNLLRFTEASFNKASLFNDLLLYPAYLELLMKLFGYSRYFADILVRDPGLFRWLTTSSAMNEPLSKGRLEEEIRRLQRTFEKPERRLDAVKRLQRRELLRIGAQDIMKFASLAGVTLQLSNLADLSVDAALAVAMQQLSDRYPLPPRTPFAVIGLGKLGGGELNYSSDIDILFVYGAEGDTRDADGHTISHHEYFNKLSERLVQNLSQPSAEGYLYRVDTRLRPESGAGPLARSLHSFLLYYESRGEIWERQMLIKARPVGGDAALGRQFIDQLQPFVYPRTFFEHPAESIARIKARIEAKVGDEANIKLMAGGIRDIEFIVQALQLLNGGKKKNLREPNTMRGIEGLVSDGLLAEPEGSVLTDAYVFYRTLEHRLQTLLNTQTHTLPSDDATLQGLARRMDLPTAAALHEALRGHLAAVRQIFDQVLSLRNQAVPAGITAVIDGGIADEQRDDILRGFGLRDLRQAARHMRSLTGLSLTGASEFDARARDALRGVAPELFPEIAKTPDPDLTLRNLTLLVTAQPFPQQIYSELREPQFRKFVLDLCAVSSRFARGLSRSPLLLETIASDIGSLAQGTMVALPPATELPDFKAQQELRAGVRHVLGFSSFEHLTRELSDLADFIVGTVTAQELRKEKVRASSFAVLALGKLGTRELGFDADIDLLFVADAATVQKGDAAEKAASGIMRRLSEVSERGKLYDVDARLRPEGRNSPLVVELGAYKKYLQERASFWERQSLTRLRFVCGDEQLGRKVMTAAEAFVYDAPLPAGWVKDTVAMRRKMEKRTRTRGPELVDIKLGPGGMADVEFLVQMIQLRAGREGRSLQGRSVPEILHMTLLPVLEDAERTQLLSTYLFYRDAVNLMRITLEERGSVLPGGAALETLARCLIGASGEALRSRLGSNMKETRALFLKATGRMSA
jgi:glutamate-ammonia-ligase adenylyltransferase